MIKQEKEAAQAQGHNKPLLLFNSTTAAAISAANTNTITHFNYALFYKFLVEFYSSQA